MGQIRMSKEVPWRRVLVEGVVIVGSILLALGLEAWWADQSERRAEREELWRVHDELVADRDNVLFFERLHGYSAAASLDLIALIDDMNADSGAILAPDRQLARVLTTNEFETRTPALDGLLRSTGITLVSDVSVRAAIAQWDSRVRDTRSSEDKAIAFISTLLLPALIDRGDLGHVLQNRVTRLGSLDEDGVTMIRADPTLKALLAERHTTAALAQLSITQVSAALDSVVAVIRATTPRNGR
jgi:hypothetical protein